MILCLRLLMGDASGSNGLPDGTSDIRYETLFLRGPDSGFGLAGALTGDSEGKEAEFDGGVPTWISS